MTRVDKEHSPLRSPQLVALADKLVADIRRRGLKEGEGYLTTEQAGRMLGVRKATANLAMRYLADREILVRRRRSGTFVGPRIGGHQTKQIQCVRFLTPLQKDRPDLPYAEMLAGAEEVLPAASIHLDVLPKDRVTSYVEHLLEDSRQKEELTGFIPSSCPREIYRLMIESEQPAVVLGTNYPDTMALPSVNANFDQMGRLFIDYMLRHGRRNIALLTYQVWYPGENKLLDSMNRALVEAHVQAGMLSVRSIGPEISLFEAEVRQLLDSEDHPTGLVCRNRLAAQAAARMARDLGLSVPGDVAIIYEERSHWESHEIPFPCVVRPDGERHYARMAAEMLESLARGETLDPKHVELPVELREPAL